MLVGRCIIDCLCAAAAVGALQQTKAVGALSPPSPVLERAGWALSFLEEITPVSWLAASLRPANATASDSSTAFERERQREVNKQRSKIAKKLRMIHTPREKSERSEAICLWYEAQRFLLSNLW